MKLSQCDHHVTNAFYYKGKGKMGYKERRRMKVKALIGYAAFVASSLEMSKHNCEARIAIVILFIITCLAIIVTLVLNGKRKH